MEKPDFSIFYSLECINLRREFAEKNQYWGSFITTEQNDLFSEFTSQLVNDVVYKKNELPQDKSVEPLFNDIMKKLHSNEIFFRSSTKYYFDCYSVIMEHKGVVNKIVEVGPHFGDLSGLLAGMLEHLEATLDLVDMNPIYLFKTYEQIKKLFPEAASKVKLFFGDLPSYIKNVAGTSTQIHLIHYQGSYNFNDVVRDIGATYFARQKIVGTIIHNTHLRTTDMNYYAFVDVALYALFGLNVQFLKLGEQEDVKSELYFLSQPSIYFAHPSIDGMYLPYAVNHFRYPHPNTQLEDFFAKNEIPAAISS